MRPIIGITTSTPRVGETTYLGQTRDYFEAVSRAGGLPVLLPLIDDGLTADALLDRVDGLLLSGGVDVDPLHWGEDPHPGLGEVNPERDRTELALCRAALARGTPLLGICRGAQVLAVAVGGSLWQDIPSQVPGAIMHRQQAPRAYPIHEVRLTPGSRLAAILGATSIRTNSFHHQAVKELPAGWRVTGVAPDGLIEAFEAEGPGFAIGVQWHPECIAAAGGDLSLFQALNAAAVEARSAPSR